MNIHSSDKNDAWSISAAKITVSLRPSRLR